MARTRRAFGSIRRLPSGRYQANYTGPDTRIHNAPSTFEARLDSEAWLADVRRRIERGEWVPPGSQPDTAFVTFGDYAEAWLRDRPLKPRTTQEYGSLLRWRILPTFADTRLTAISPPLVRQWYAAANPDQPAARAHAYALLSSILATAVADDLIGTQPCRIRGASTVTRRHQIRPATLDELTAIVDAMPPRYKTLTLLAAWTAARFGELAELRRRDIDTKNGTIEVRRAVTRVGGKPVIGTPKSSAGVRTVAIPPHLLPTLKRHVLEYAEPGRDGLVFPAREGGNMAPSSLWKVWSVARETGGRPDLRWHDLRHTSATLAAQTGATLRELMARLGHSTPTEALRYQHAAEDADLRIAAALSQMANGLDK